MTEDELMSKQDIGKYLHKERYEILSFCRRYSRIYIWGTSWIAIEMMRYLLEEDINCEGYIVSAVFYDRTEIAGKPVLRFEGISFDASCGIILGMGVKSQNDVVEFLRARDCVDMHQVYAQRIFMDKWTFRDFSMLQDHLINGSNDGFFTQFEELDSLGQISGTDKCHKKNNYLKKYEFFLHKFKDTEIKLLELGVYHGQSLEMWQHYFKKGTIYGIDLDEDCKQYSGYRKHILIKDLSNEEELRELRDIQADVIIDDASHLWSHQIKALWQLLPSQPQGGIYIVEDIGTSFRDFSYTYDDAVISCFEFLQLVNECVVSRGGISEKSIGTAMYLREYMEKIASEIEMMSFISGSCIIIKK